MAYDFEKALKSGVTPQQITNYLSQQNRTAEAEAYFNMHPNISENWISKSIRGFGKYFNNVWNDYKQGAENILSDLSNPNQSPLSSSLQTVGEVAKGAFSPINRAIEPVINFAGNKISDIPAVQKFASGKGGEAILGTAQKAQVAYDKWKLQHPEASKNLEASVNIGLLLGTEKPAQSVIEKGLQETKAITTKVGDLGGDLSKQMVEVAKPIATKSGGALKGLGEKAYGIGIKMEEPTRIALQNYESRDPSLLGRIKNFFKPSGVGGKPITEAGTAARKGLYGTEWQLGVQAKSIAGDLWKKVVSPVLKSTKDRIDFQGFLNDLKSDVMKTADLNRRNTLLDALGKFSEDYKRVKKVGFNKFQQYKEGWTKFVPEATYKGKPISGALNEIRNLAAGKARDLIYDKFGPEMKQAYIDYGNLKSISKEGIKVLDQLREKSFSRQVWEVLLDKAVTPVTTIAGKWLYKTGEGLEFIGEKGAKNLRDIIGATEKPPSRGGEGGKPKTLKGDDLVAEYWISHRPSETGAIASDISKNGELIPKDVYEHPEWYADMGNKTYQESFTVLKKIRGKPEAEITVYRASLKKGLNRGDWITLSKTYADQEGLGEGMKTYSYKVRARDIQFAGDDLNEFGYFPK